MEFVVKKGVIKYNGSFLTKGSIFDAEKREVENLLVSGIIAKVESELQASTPFSKQPKIEKGMTIEEIKKFLEDAGIEEVKELLEYERSKTKPRSKAIKLLEDWLQEATDGDAALPKFDGTDVIVPGENE